jgi:hypothetical protein
LFVINKDIDDFRVSCIEAVYGKNSLNLESTAMVNNFDANTLVK